MSATGAAWLVPLSDKADPLGFKLVDALQHVTSVPFAFAGERDLRFVRAGRWMAKVAEVTTQ